MPDKPEALDNPVDSLQPRDDRTRALQQIEYWMRWNTKLYLGVLNQFYMIRYEGVLMPGEDDNVFFQSESGEKIIIFTAACDSYSWKEIEETRAQVTLGRGGALLMLTEDIEELAAVLEYATRNAPVQ
jgi:hypothetical protein